MDSETSSTGSETGREQLGGVKVDSSPGTYSPPEDTDERQLKIIVDIWKDQGTSGFDASAIFEQLCNFELLRSFVISARRCSDRHIYAC